MLVLRFLGALCLVGMAASVVAYLLTGNRRFLTYSGWIFRFALGVLLLFVALLALERLLVPVA